LAANSPATIGDCEDGWEKSHVGVYRVKKWESS